MKLRLHSNTLRLRLNQGEVAALAAGGVIEESLLIAPGQSLTWALSVTTATASVAASFRNGRLEILLPQSLASGWASSDQVGIEAHPQDAPHIVIEKDFQCLHGDQAPDSQAFPNPCKTPA
jgi:hypothetical protein